MIDLFGANVSCSGNAASNTSSNLTSPPKEVTSNNAGTLAESQRALNDIDSILEMPRYPTPNRADGAEILTEGGLRGV